MKSHLIIHFQNKQYSYVVHLKQETYSYWILLAIDFMFSFAVVAQVVVGCIGFVGNVVAVPVLLDKSNDLCNIFGRILRYAHKKLPQDI